MNPVGQADSRLCSNESPSDVEIIKELNYDDSIDRLDRIMDFYSMSQLLQPKHEYFEDKKACITGFESYKQPEHKKFLVFSKLGGLNGERMPRGNPYRRQQLAKSHTARRIKMIKKFIESYCLAGFRFAFLTLTMPKELSVWLSYQENGKDIAWRMFSKFWDWYDGHFGSGLGAAVNLHTWRSEIPFEPHFHFHALIPNYKKRLVDIEDDNGEKAYEFERLEWHRQRGGRLVPVSKEDLIEMKLAWWLIIAKVCQTHNVGWYGLESSEYSQKLDIHFAYACWWDIGKVKLMHWFNYQGRCPLEDYAKYSNKHLDCPNPPEWLVNYDNHSRAFGWWKGMNKLVEIEKEDKIKINPVTGGRMEYYGMRSIYELMEEGNIGFLEVIRGKPIFHRLSYKEMTWLISVQRDLHPGIKRAMLYDTQVGDMEENE